MFTGIVQAVGRIVSTKPLVIDAGKLPLAGVRIGDSICVQGCCLTVTNRAGRRLWFDVSPETLRVTAGLARPGAVNLEKSLALGDRLGGHLVTGHVDGVGACASVKGGVYAFHAPAALSRYVARKGSVTVDGVSLTVNAVRGRRFEVNLIPHTLAVTTLGRLAAGARVNLEVDLLARYVERLRDRG
ncbi:MAG: riboflavin synthase [Betaproteobacteria bacterium]|nr:riboflavin synthase [Betaproteobacteria bacterium]